jgi:hypothetical protein
MKDDIPQAYAASRISLVIRPTTGIILATIIIRVESVQAAGIYTTGDYTESPQVKISCN